MQLRLLLRVCKVGLLLVEYSLREPLNFTCFEFFCFFDFKRGNFAFFWTGGGGILKIILAFTLLSNFSVS